MSNSEESTYLEAEKNNNIVLKTGCGSWGCIHIFQDSPNSLEEIRAKVIELFQEHNLQLSTESYIENLTSSELSSEGSAAFLKDLKLNTINKITSDKIIILPESTPGWIAVMSYNFEWTLAGQNPIATQLSKFWEVVTMTMIENCYSEICLYANGQVKARSIVGNQRPSDEVDLSSAENFNYDYFLDKGSVANAVELNDALEELNYFGELAGPDARGFREACEEAPLIDYKDQLLVFN